MPYDSTAELPDRVRNAIPGEAGRRMFMRVVNAQMDRDLPESRAFASAWAALQRAGYKKNPDGKYIRKSDMSAKTREALQNKVKQHNEKHGDTASKRATLSMLQAVYRRGVGAYRTNPSSVRPNVSSPEQWAMGRVNDFLRILSGSRKTRLYDQDLLPSSHPKHSNKEEKSSPSLSSVHTPNADDKLSTMKADTYQPPESAKNNAQQVLDWKEEHGDEVKGMTDVGWSRARQLASGKPVSRDTVSRMAQFNRHRENGKLDEEHKGEPWKDAGYVAWLGWGGTTGVDWARRTMDSISKASGARTLYASRPLLNAEDVIAHYKAQGVETMLLPDDMHVTIAYSKDPIRWEDMGVGYEENVRIEAGAREHEILGGKAFTLCFDAPRIVSDWLHFRMNGAGYDYAAYRPHITLTYSAPERVVEPYSGPLIFGAIEMQEVDPPESIMEKRQTSDHQFTTAEEARAASYGMGCGGDIHVHDTEDGVFYMPGETHEAYLERVREIGGINESEDDDEGSSDTLERALRVVMESIMSKSFTMQANVVKANEEERIVYGWASIVTMDGKPVIDKQGHIISGEEMEKMATSFMMSERTAKAMHTGESIGQIIHSFPLTAQIAKAIGMETDVEGWFIGVKVHSDAVWQKIKNGDFKAFSIGGRGKLRNA